MSVESLKQMGWLERLEHVRDYAATPAEHEMLRRLAEQWPTCACGELCEALPRDCSGAPVDYPLKVLGGNFYTEIKEGQWVEALATFHEIESRTAEILAAQERGEGWL